ncbi:PTS sugar transporter subunit IIA [Salinigranum salinum]|uniref:PTS sugar transporter subunit IIA n=1 Tax=Salinigranum salinum TaxID=1364937 RepID=UPI0012605563|nr:PTS sugar transporter subunit IIA [Salinigranum salinum]
MTIDSTTIDRLIPPEPVTLAEPPSHLPFALLSPAGNDDGVDHREVPSALSRALVDERVRESSRTATSTTAVRGTPMEVRVA